MGAELGATTSIFPSDEETRKFFKAQGREDEWVELKADEDALYDEEIVIDLSTLEPLVAQPHSPDAVDTVANVGGIKVDQVAIGSCTNSSYLDLMKVAGILKGKTVHPDVSLVIAPGSKQVYSMLAKNGALADMIDAGARILESACGPCIGMGQAPASNAVSVRSFNRNFYGRSGTPSAKVYLTSPEVAAITALTGYLTDPRTIGEYKDIEMPEEFLINDNSIIPPAENGDEVEVVRGPNIKPFPINTLCRTGKRGCTPEDGGQYYNRDHIMPPTQSCCHTGPTFPICRITALFRWIRNSPRGQRKQEAGSW